MARVLVVSNYYPPYAVGGYELAIADTANGLADLGHEVSVITGREGRSSAGNPSVHRRLAHLVDGRQYSRTARGLRQLLNVVTLSTEVRSFRPDVILVGNPWQLGAAAVDFLHLLDTPVVHDISDEFLLSMSAGFGGHHRHSGPAIAAARALTRTTRHKAPVLDLELSYYRSEYLRRRFAQSGAPAVSSPVHHHGVDLELYPFRDDRDRQTIGYAGRCSPDKGVDVLLDAMELLRARGVERVVLKVAFAGSAGGPYGDMVRRRLTAIGQWCPVTVEVGLGRRAAAGFMDDVGVFVLPATWAEPYSIGVLEALASGQIVIATDTGGTPEAIDGENGLLVRSDDAHAIADAINTILVDREAGDRILDASRRTRFPAHHIARAIQGIDAHIRTVVAGS